MARGRAAAVAGPRGEGVERREGRRPGAWLRGEGDEDAGQRGEGGGMDARPQGSDARAAKQQGEGCKDARPQGGGGGEACGVRGQPRGLVGNTLPAAGPRWCTALLACVPNATTKWPRHTLKLKFSELPTENTVATTNFRYVNIIF